MEFSLCGNNGSMITERFMALAHELTNFSSRRETLPASQQSVHSVPSCKKRSYKKRLVDMATVKKHQLVEIDMVKKRVSYSK